MYAPLISIDPTLGAAAPQPAQPASVDAPRLRQVLQQALEALRRTPPQVPITDPEYLAAVPDWLRDEPPSSWGLHQGAIAAVEKQLKDSGRGARGLGSGARQRCRARCLWRGGQTTARRKPRGRSPDEAGTHRSAGHVSASQDLSSRNPGPSGPGGCQHQVSAASIKSRTFMTGRSFTVQRLGEYLKDRTEMESPR